MAEATPVVAISADFLTAFANVPRSQQKKVREFAERFRANPTSGAINYEPMQRAKDPQIRTVRIGRDYRAIVVHPETGNVYLLAWVDHHDKAMSWAANKVFDVNAQTGALQVFDAEQVAFEEHEPTSEPVQPERRTGLFDDCADKDLLALGTPAALLPSVRAIETEEDLDSTAPHLPEEVSEALYGLAAGLMLSEVRNEIDARKAEDAAKTRDYRAALEHPDSQRRFAIVDTEQELSEMLNAPLQKWRVFLHPSQRALVSKNFNGPARVLGGAGTGKTVVAMHRARYLAEKFLKDEGDRVLFVTFTRNLARNIEANVRALCGDSPALGRIDVTNLHRWVADFCRRQKMPVSIATDEERDECWHEALAASPVGHFAESFYKAEWEHVVQAQALRTRDEYLRAPRVGRGTRLSRRQKAEVWQVLAEYRAALDRRGKQDHIDVVRETAAYLEQRPALTPYRAAVVDESQDLHPDELRLIRTIVPEGPNDLFLVGDAHQRIYSRRAVLKHCGIHVVGRSSKLRLNYRTTEEIRNWAVALLEGREIDDLDGGVDDQRGFLSLLHGHPPEVRPFRTLQDELDFVVARVRELSAAGPPEHICIVARTNRLLRDDYGPALERAGIAYTQLDAQKESDAGEGVRLATMHRVKGLEFPHMIVAAANEGVIPLAVAMDAAADEAEKRDAELQERCLLYVAVTRARDSVVVTGYGPLSSFVPS